MAALLSTPSPDFPSGEISRLHSAGFSLLPLGGGADGKSPLCSFKGAEKLPIKRVLGLMHSKGSMVYGIRLNRLAVIDCDEDDPNLVGAMEARFGVSPVHIATPRGRHLYYRHEGGQLPNLRSEGLPVDIKRGASAYVVGPLSIRPDGGGYSTAVGCLGLDTLPNIASASTSKTPTVSRIAVGDRNRELSVAAIQMVEAVETADELFDNLAFVRDDECEDPATVTDEELRKIADWAWIKRLEGKVYRDRNSEFRLDRNAMDILAAFGNASEALSLYVVLQANHGHTPGKTFNLSHEGMTRAGHTSLGRPRFHGAVKTLCDAGLLGIAKEYSVGRHSRRYRLLRLRPEMPNVQSIFAVKECR